MPNSNVYSYRQNKAYRQEMPSNKINFTINQNKIIYQNFESIPENFEMH